MDRLVVQTPIYKEVLLACTGIAGTAAGIAVSVLGYREHAWHILGIGILWVGLLITAFFREAMSRTVLIADSGGICVRLRPFSKMKKILWADIIGFDKVTQVLSDGSAELSHLAIHLRRPEENVGAVGRLITERSRPQLKEGKTYILGDLYLPSLELPGDIDALVTQLSERRRTALGLSSAPRR